jgi:hypothetical protein
MTRQELREKFRDENPEATTRVVTDTELNAWMLVANNEICTFTRCIVQNEPEVIESVVGTQFYDLEAAVSNFLDIDDMPGGGVYYDNKPLILSSPGEMNRISKNWRTASDGTPKRYWRRGKYLWLDRAPDTANVDISVEIILKADDFDQDSEEPFNGLGHLQAYSDSINKYLQWRLKRKLGKSNEAKDALDDYNSYLTLMKKAVKAGKYGPVSIRPSSFPSQGSAI